MKNYITRFLATLSIFALASCSSSGINSHPATVSTAQPTLNKIVLTQSGSITAGSPGSFTLLVSVGDSDGNLITGTYPKPLTLSSNTTDLNMSLGSSQSTTSTQTVNVVQSGTIVTINYDGNVLNNASITATASNGATGKINIQTGQSQIATVANIALAQAGVLNANIAGSFAITVIAYDANGNLLTGVYPQPITLVSSNTHLFLSAKQVSAANTTVVVTYDGQALDSAAAITAITGNVQSTLPIVAGNGESAKTIASLSFSGISGINTYGSTYVKDTASGVFSLSLTAYDVAGQVITGPYSQPVTITPSSTTITFQQSGITATTGTVTSGSASNIVVFYNYNAGPPATTFKGITLTASVGNVSSSYTLPTNP